MASRNNLLHNLDHIIIRIAVIVLTLVAVVKIVVAELSSLVK